MRSIPIIGVLAQHSDVPEWWTSRPIPIPFFSDKPLRFIITDDPVDSVYQPDVESAVANFLSLGETDRIIASEPVYQNYRDFLEAVEVEELPVGDPIQIWHFVTPTEIYVSRRHRRDCNVYIQVACECAWEDEHGLQLVFRRGKKLIRVSNQDGHLTEADAYNLPEEEEA
jgi:hypothetical protein